MRLSLRRMRLFTPSPRRRAMCADLATIVTPLYRASWSSYISFLIRRNGLETGRRSPSGTELVLKWVVRSGGLYRASRNLSLVFSLIYYHSTARRYIGTWCLFLFACCFEYILVGLFTSFVFSYLISSWLLLSWQQPKGRSPRSGQDAFLFSLSLPPSPLCMASIIPLLNDWSFSLFDRAIAPPVQWAQRTHVVFVTLCVEDCKNPDIQIEADKIVFKGTGGTEKKKYELTIPLFKEIDPEVCWQCCLVV